MKPNFLNLFMKNFYEYRRRARNHRKIIKALSAPDVLKGTGFLPGPGMRLAWQKISAASLV